MEPWCSASSVGSSSHTDCSALCHNSACERVLANNKVLRTPCRRATTRCNCERPRWPAHANRSPASGSRVSRVSDRGFAASMIGASGACGSRASRASPRLPSVADKPQLRIAGDSARRRARHSCSRTPRLLPSNSCHSSTMTARKPRSWPAVSGYDSNSAKDSGVITSTSDWPLRASRLSRALASPVRIATVHGSPSASIGSRSARVVSLASARNGVIHSTRVRAATISPRLRFGGGGSRKACSSGPPRAARVLPLPVGVTSNPSRPAR